MIKRWARTPRPSTAATRARPLSRPLTPMTTGIRETVDGAGERGAEAAVAVATTAGAVPTGRTEGGAAAVIGGATTLVTLTLAGAAVAAVGAATPPVDGPGSRTVGAAVGLGGKLMRTVSFLG